jgi:hypothetical protein
MNKSVLLLMVSMAFCSLGLAQGKSEKKTVTQVLDGSVKSIEGEFIPAVEAMPEEKFGFAPTNGEFKGVRTFAQQVKHVAAINYMLAAAILGEKTPLDTGGENGPDTVQTKTDIVKFARDSFAYAHKAVASITEANAVEAISGPFGKEKVTRLGLATTFSWHGFDHYGQMVVYLRMNGIVPPASRN